MNKVERPIRWDTNAKATSVRITKRKKDIILREYDEMMDRDENRDDILVKLAEKYGRNTRTIERYIHDAREAQKTEQSKVMQALHDKVVATLAPLNHWQELATLAGELVSLWEEYNVGHPVGGYDGYIIDDPLMIELPSGLLSSLLMHLKYEFPEFGNIKDWRELLKIDTAQDLIVKLALVAHRKTLKGTCPFCKD